MKRSLLTGMILASTMLCACGPSGRQKESAPKSDSAAVPPVVDTVVVPEADTVFRDDSSRFDPNADISP